MDQSVNRIHVTTVNRQVIKLAASLSPLTSCTQNQFGNVHKHVASALGQQPSVLQQLIKSPVEATSVFLLQRCNPLQAGDGDGESHFMGKAEQKKAAAAAPRQNHKCQLFGRAAFTPESHPQQLIVWGVRLHARHVTAPKSAQSVLRYWAQKPSGYTVFKKE